ncbi:restriction endonuclease subunit S [Pseudomonas sp. 2835]|uniref:restriction endonuclease subunit S n=1 Tax=Pseudomonas sp. 2835 TaxID=3156451 RepID=UPI003D19635C
MSHYKPYPAYKDSGVEWLGRVPEHWVTKKLLYWISGYGSGTTPSSEDEYSTDGIPWVTTGELRENTVFSTDKCVTHDALKNNSALKLHPAGSLVIAMYGATVGRLGVLGIEATLNQACFAIHPSERVMIPFLRHWFEGFRTELVGLATGAGQPNISGDKIRNLLLPCPQELSEQAAIITHLDRETARIDALIGKNTRFIELLREKRQALITHAITKGLDPKAKLKDSGVEWLGEVPEHWVIKRFRDISISISTGPFGTALGNEDYVTGGIPVINPSHIVDEQCSPDPDITVSADTAERLSFWAMRAGDLVTARRGELGRAAIIFNEQDGWICGTGSLRVRPNSSQVLTGYLHTVLQSRYAREWLNLASVGATMANLNEGILGSLPLALPPSTTEQEQLLSSLATQSERLIKIEQKATLSVALLKERRSALITAAVTGQIDLREVV